MKPEYPVFRFPYRVFYADTDAGGVVYYAQYLRMFEQARGLYAERVGLSLLDLARQDYLFVCRRAEIDYRSPALLEDRLEVETRIVEAKRFFLTFAYRVECVNRLEPGGEFTRIAEGLTKMVCVGASEESLRPKMIPDWVMERLSGSDTSNN